ncbi:porin family protein [Rhizobiales bacterium Sp-1]|uniref:Porin family protein n=2 Tax=Segnochrobactrum spirostomi TaxID=2608987 RepID=A0A6A7Y6K6_9HYPH|nr:porin family protein [Segnochrobactrum spirostomi]
MIPAVPDDFGPYARADLGVAFPDASHMSLGGAAPATVSSPDFDAVATAGLGLGWRFTPWLRSDLTFDYAPAVQATGGCAACGGPSARADVSSLAILANAYVDFPVLGPVTPYVGAGIGTARLETSNAAVSGASGAVAAPPGAASWGFAYAFTGGLAVKLNDAVSVDVGYRYLDLGDAATGSGWTSAGPAKLKIDDVTTQQVRIGLRYRFE